MRCSTSSWSRRRCWRFARISSASVWSPTPSAVAVGSLVYQTVWDLGGPPLSRLVRADPALLGETGSPRPSPLLTPLFGVAAGHVLLGDSADARSFAAAVALGWSAVSCRAQPAMIIGGGIGMIASCSGARIVRRDDGRRFRISAGRRCGRMTSRCNRRSRHCAAQAPERGGAGLLPTSSEAAAAPGPGAVRPRLRAIDAEPPFKGRDPAAGGGGARTKHPEIRQALCLAIAPRQGRPCRQGGAQACARHQAQCRPMRAAFHELGHPLALPGQRYDEAIEVLNRGPGGRADDAELASCSSAMPICDGANWGRRQDGLRPRAGYFSDPDNDALH